MSRIIALVLTVILAAGACGRPEPPEKVNTDHQIGKAGRAVVNGDGPAPGLLTADWRAEAGAKLSNFRVEAGNLVAFGPDGVHGFDAATGRKVWHYREPERQVEWSGLTGGVVLLHTVGGKERLVALDAGTGRLLWEQQPEPSTTYYTGAEGVLVRDVHRDFETELLISAIDARTGEELWDGGPDLLKGCEGNVPIPEASDGSVIVVAEECGQILKRLHGLDPADGDVLWSHDSPIGKPVTTISIAGGRAVLTPSKPFSTIIFGRDGVREIDASRTTCTPCLPLAVGDQLAWLHEGAAEQPRMAVHDTRTGATKTIESMMPETDLISDGRRLYGLRERLAGHAHGTPRYWVTVTDPVTTSSETLPIHTAQDSRPIVWMGTAGGRLIVAQRSGEGTSTYRLTAYGSAPAAGPLEYGGVDPRTWPDCAQLLAAVPGKRDPGRPDREDLADDGLFERATLRPSTCTARTDAFHRISVTVVWVTKRPEDADALVNGRPGTPPGADEVAEGVVRVGNVIVHVWDSGSDEAEQAVIKQLRSMVW